MALIDGLGGSKRWNRWLSVVDRVALSAWNTQLTSLHLLRMRAERAAKSEKKSRKKTKKWREIKKKLIKKSTVYQPMSLS